MTDREVNRRSLRKSNTESHWQADACGYTPQDGGGSRSMSQPRSRSKSQPRSRSRASEYHDVVLQHTNSNMRTNASNEGDGRGTSRRSTSRGRKQDAYSPQESRRISRGNEPSLRSPFGAPTRVNDTRKENIANISVERIYTHVVPDTRLHPSNQGTFRPF